MASIKQKRNYSLTGPESKLAQERGLVAAEWYTSPISRQRLKELMKRKDGPAIRDTIIWFMSLSPYAYGTVSCITLFASRNAGGLSTRMH